MKGCDAAQWPSLLQELKDLNLDAKPYYFSKRSRNFDHEIRLMTPFAQTAGFVQRNEKDEAAMTLERSLPFLTSGVVTLEVSSMARGREQAEAVQAALKTDAKSLTPIASQHVTTRLRQVGFYAEPYYQALKTFSFDAEDLAGATFLSIVVTEPEGKTLEIEVDLKKLR
ncbi:MAG: hypothetical protein AB1824_03240 [Acidobacteriota bacterium]